MRYVIGLGFLFLAAWSGIQATAELIAIGPRSMVSAMAKRDQLPISTDWSVAYQLLSRSAAFDRWDADLRFEMGRLAWWQAFNPDSDERARRAWLAKSVGHLEAALALRPSWGRAWAELAYVEMQRGELLNSYHALTRAMHYEPYEGKTQWMALATGFAIWPMLLGDVQAQFVHIARHVLNHDYPQWAVVPAIAYRREDVIRPIVPVNTWAAKLFERKLKARDSAPRGER